MILSQIRRRDYLRRTFIWHVLLKTAVITHPLPIGWTWWIAQPTGQWVDLLASRSIFTTHSSRTKIADPPAKYLASTPVLIKTPQYYLCYKSYVSPPLLKKSPNNVGIMLYLWITIKINKSILACTSRKHKALLKSPLWNTQSAYTYLNVRME